MELRKISMNYYTFIFAPIFGYYVFSKTILPWIIFIIPSTIYFVKRLKLIHSKSQKIKIFLFDISIMLLLILLGSLTFIHFRSIIIILIMGLYLHYYFKKYVDN
jgi:Ca2+/Na+ antiporter